VASIYQNSIERTAEEKEELIKRMNTVLRYLEGLILIGLGLYLYLHK
jgi:hypothetical protein